AAALDAVRRIGAALALDPVAGAAADGAVRGARRTSPVRRAGHRSAGALRTRDVAGLALTGARAVAAHAIDAVARGAPIRRRARRTRIELGRAHAGRAVAARGALRVHRAIPEARGRSADEGAAVLGLHRGAGARAVAVRRE